MLGRQSGRWNPSQPRRAILRFYLKKNCLWTPFLACTTYSAANSPALNVFRHVPLITPLPRGDKKNKAIPQKKSNVFKKPGESSKLEGLSALKSPIGDSDIPISLLLSMDKYFAVQDPTEATLHRGGSRWDAWKNILEEQESVCRFAEKLAGSTAPYRALRLLKIARAVGTGISRNRYERVVYQLVVKKEWVLVQEVINVALAEEKPSVRLLDWQALALIETQDFAGLSALINIHVKYEITPRRRTIGQLLRGHLLNHDLERARDVMKQLERVGLGADTSTYKTILSVYHGLGLDDFIVEKANEILADPEESLQSKVTALNGLIRIHLSNHNLTGALSLIEKFGNMENGDEHARDLIKIDTATYTILLSYLARHQSLDLLDRILKRIEVVDLRPDARVASSLIHLYYALGSETPALQVLKDACLPTVLDLETLKHLGYDGESDIPRAFRDYRGGPTVAMFNSIIESALPLRGFRVFNHILKLMESCNIYPDATTLEIFLSHLEKEKHILSVDVSRVLNKLMKCDIQPTIKHLNVILRSIVRNDKMKAHSCGWHGLAYRVSQTLKALDPVDMEALKIKEAPPLIDPELSITSRQTQTVIRLLRPIVESLVSRSIKADRTTFALRMRFDSFALPPNLAAVSAEKTLQHMQDRGMHPTVYHYSALMEAYCASGNVEMARSLLLETRSRGLMTGVESAVLMYTILISAYGRQGRPDLALSIFQEMLDENITPDIAAVDAVVGAFFAVKAFHLARRVLIDLWPMVAPFPRELLNAPLKSCITRLRELRVEAEKGRVGLGKRKSGIKLKPGLVAQIIREWQMLMVTKRRKEKQKRVGHIPCIGNGSKIEEGSTCS